VPDLADPIPYMLYFIRFLEVPCVIPVDCALMFVRAKVCVYVLSKGGKRLKSLIDGL
jgi:hypothetical protein